MTDITISDTYFQPSYSQPGYTNNSSYDKFTNKGYYFGGVGEGAGGTSFNGGDGGDGFYNTATINVFINDGILTGGGGGGGGVVVTGKYGAGGGDGGYGGGGGGGSSTSVKGGNGGGFSTITSQIQPGDCYEPDALINNTTVFNGSGGGGGGGYNQSGGTSTYTYSGTNYSNDNYYASGYSKNYPAGGGWILTVSSVQSTYNSYGNSKGGGAAGAGMSYTSYIPSVPIGIVAGGGGGGGAGNGFGSLFTLGSIFATPPLLTSNGYNFCCCGGGGGSGGGIGGSGGNGGTFTPYTGGKGGNGGCGINNLGTIVKLINYQSQGTYGPLYYTGNLPSSYYIGYNGSTFGQVQFIINTNPNNVYMTIGIEQYTGNTFFLNNAVVFINLYSGSYSSDNPYPNVIFGLGVSSPSVTTISIPYSYQATSEETGNYIYMYYTFFSFTLEINVTNYLVDGNDLSTIFAPGDSSSIITTGLSTNINGTQQDLSEIFAPFSSGTKAIFTKYYAKQNGNYVDLNEIFLPL